MNIDNIKEIIAARIRPDKNIIASKGQIIIYGAGATGRRVLNLLKKYHLKASCFLDKNGGRDIFIDGIPVLAPDDKLIDKEARVIVALFNHRDDVISVISFLEKIGFTDIIPYTKFFIHFADELPAQYWLGPTEGYEIYLQEIAETLALFEDEASRHLFNSFLKFRLTGDPAWMPRPDIENIYFPSDIPERRRPDKFIDCGAFDGDTLLAIRKRFGVIESIRAFEPDPVNFRQLVAMVAEGEKLSHDTVLLPCGVWSETVQLKFMSDHSPTSRISEQGDLMVQGVALDQCLQSYVPTFIKMDIEGGEVEALNGGKKMIASAKPDLAISVYHQPDHLWKIPLLVSKFNPDYKCYLRSHCYNGYDTVFYAYNRNL